MKSSTSRFLLSLLAGVFLLAGCGSAPKVKETTLAEPATELYFPPDSGERERIDPVSAGWDYVVPSLGIVFTRLGDEPHEQQFSNEIWKRLMKAVPKAG